MTIIDVALHKWRMLDDRRRKIIIGLTLIIIALVIAISFVVGSYIASADEDHNENQHNTSGNQNSPTDSKHLSTLTNLS